MHSLLMMWQGITLVSASDLGLSDKMNKVERAKTVGAKLAANAKQKHYCGRI